MKKYPFASPANSTPNTFLPQHLQRVVVATITAFSYLELVTKYPQAAGAALYTHKAFGIHFVTFLVAFTVMSSGITSAANSSSDAQICSWRFRPACCMKIT